MQTTTRLFSLCLLILVFYSCQSSPGKKQPVDWVDPQIGSVHGRWFFYTPAALPMGMAKLPRPRMPTVAMVAGYPVDMMIDILPLKDSPIFTSSKSGAL